MSGTTLTTSEASRFAELEATIERTLDSFREAGEALREIRDSKLYRQEFLTFEQYCRTKWDMTDRRGRQLMQAVEIGTTVPVRNERQARELARLDGGRERQRAWEDATERAETENRSVTAADVRRAVEDRLPEPPLKPKEAAPAEEPKPDQPPAHAPEGSSPASASQSSEPSESPAPEQPAPQSAAEKVEALAAGCRRLPALVDALEVEAAVKEQPEAVQAWRDAFRAADDALASLTEKLDDESRQRAEVEATASRAGIDLR